MMVRNWLVVAACVCVGCAVEVVEEGEDPTDSVEATLEPDPILGAVPGSGTPAANAAMLERAEPGKPTPDPWRDLTGDCQRTPEKPTPDPWAPGENGDPSMKEGSEE